MTHLRKIMLEELRRRNYAQSTIDCYLRTVEHFSRHFNRSPDQLGPEHIREYRAAFVHEVEVGVEHGEPATGGTALLLCSGSKTRLERWRNALPEEGCPPAADPQSGKVARLIDAAESSFYRVLLMTLYATGARRQVAHLKISDINSQRMVVHIPRRSRTEEEINTKLFALRAGGKISFADRPSSVALS